MARISLPYGAKHLTADIPDDRLAGVLVSRAHEYRPDKSEEGLVLAALANPVGSPRLRDLARGRKNIVRLRLANPSDREQLFHLALETPETLKAARREQTCKAAPHSFVELQWELTPAAGA